MGALEDLVQCGICLEKLLDPRMLPCQHTFCLNCLQSHVVAKNMIGSPHTQHQPPSIETIQSALASRNNVIKCPVCQSKVSLEKGFDSVEKLPKNLYIVSLLKVLEGEIPSSPSKVTDYRCIKCQTYSQTQEQVCQHCMQVYCTVCWNEHLSELESTLSTLVKQIQGSKSRLEHKLENFENRCEQLNESIAEATRQKMMELQVSEKSVLSDVARLKTQSRVLHDNISIKIADLEERIIANSTGVGSHKVMTFMALHRETSRLLDEVSHYGEARIIFDPDSYKLDQDTEGVYNDVEDAETANGSQVLNPVESPESMLRHYKTRSFAPKLIWNKCPRPANVAVAPWDDTQLYIAATDTHSVLIFNRDKGKLIGRLTSEEMLYPQGVAFSKRREEIFVSDKWKHCIHVFSSNGEYVRSICSKGIGDGRVRSPDGLAMGPNEELIVCDTGNDRIIVVDPQTGEQIRMIGVVNGKTKLNMPTGVAVFENKVIIADTGNHRIKVYTIGGEKVLEFGALGRAKGQFRSAEVVAVDPLGYILVGDGGNARVQVFTPQGTLVKVFGGLSHTSDGFGWVSGVFVTKELDIITTDRKTRSLRIF